MREQLGGRRVRLTDDQRRRLAAKGRPLGRKALAQIQRNRTDQASTTQPNLNAYAERFVGSIRSECIDRMIIFGERHLRHVVSEYAEHYHHERPHQGLDDTPIEPAHTFGDGPVRCDERLGGVLRLYHRSAA